MNWKQKLAEAFHQHTFGDFNSDEQAVAEKAVELYQNELHAKIKNVSFGVPDVPENATGQTIAKSQIDWKWAEEMLKELEGR